MRDVAITKMQFNNPSPNRQINQQSRLTEAERRQILVEWNETQGEYPRDRCIHELFEAQVKRTPEAVALVCGEQAVSYQELNRRANQLAHYLQGLGVGPEVLVGICVERSIEMVVGLLGVLKAGGAYLPLDPSYPTERLGYMLADAEVKVLLSQQELVERLPQLSGRVICLDKEWERIGEGSAKTPVSGVGPENLAYVIYTSGSTGEPKGVLIEHRSLVNYSTAAAVDYGIEAGDRVLQFASISWDTSAEEIYPCLSRGATLVLRSQSMLDSVPRFLQECRKYGLTLINLPTAFWHAVVAMIGSDQDLTLPPSIRLVIIGGEKALRERVITWQQRVDRSIRLVNTYGLTEATAVTTACELSRATAAESEWQDIPIGRPIRNVEVYILDETLEPVPVGVVGELYIGGEGLARGYLNRAELTEARFIRHPFRDEAGARLYKSGDLARYLPDGNIEFLGRLDQQLKLRGYRIEPGEIEAVLKKHPGVQEAIVSDWEDKAAEKQLVGYIVLQAKKPVSNSALRHFLRQRLPDYMVPAFFVTLERVPFTPNGKVDWRALPAPKNDRSEMGVSYVAPRTQVERVLNDIWSGVLGLDAVGINDNFFELGGHSLLATQVMNRVEAVLGLQVPVRILFESPTVAEMSARIENGAIREILPESIPVISRTEELALSFAQEGVWFVEQLRPGSGVYNIPIAVRLRGKLQLKALERSLVEIQGRHELLRTRFPDLDGRPVQKIEPNEPITIRMEDLSGLPVRERETEMVRKAADEARELFKLAEGPLWRVKLFRMDREEHVLVLTMHHIISDDWSIRVLFKELSEFYAAYRRGAAPEMPALDIQYVDYARWQRERLQGRELEKALDYWRDQLRGELPILSLLAGQLRPTEQSYQGASRSMKLSEELTLALKKLSQAEGVTLFMTLMAAFQTLLYRYSGQTDILVGTPIANRRRKEVEALIGFFVNTLVLRTDLSARPSFQELLQRVRKVALEAYSHLDVPFEKLVQELKPERDLSRNPLFQVMFAFEQEQEIESLNLPGLEVSQVELESRTAEFDLTLLMEDTGAGLKGTIEYNRDLFEEDAIRRMLAHFQMLLEGVVSNPEQRISDLPLLTADEYRQILFEWNQTEAQYPCHRCLHELFEAQVERSPEAVAVEFEGEQLSYQRLNRRANQVAHYLRGKGVGPDSIVGLCVERSLEMMVGLLGILKAGGAYVPLDPAYPTERLRFMIGDAGVETVLTQKSLETKVAEFAVKAVYLDKEEEEIGRAKETNPVSGVKPDNLAYVIYTSGSTGKPKGVLIEHRGLVNYLTWCVQAYPLEAGTGAPVFTSISFDLTVTALFGPLLVGQPVHLLPNDLGVDTLGFAFREGADFSLVKLTPTHLQLLGQQLSWQEAVGRTRAMIIGGENLLYDHVAFWQEAAPDTILINEYGPTEAVVGCCVYQVPKDGHQAGSIPIGRPISNMRMYILDGNLQPVPIGVVGELHLGGVGLARGYLNRPELTAEKFIANPLRAEPGARLYRTGDLARYLPDGNIELLGRADYQVKIRGYRIELGEIEALISGHPGIKEAVVLAREDEQGGKQLVAYVVPFEAGTIASSEFRRFLRQKLPEYMVPRSFMQLEKLPLTRNGKVDRKALPAPERNYLHLEKAFVLPQSALELQLTQIWEKVLAIRPIGTNDNFFELGGHSLLAVRLFAEIEKLFRRKLPVVTLFQAPTVEQLADILCQEGVVNPGSSLVPIQPRGSNPPFFCVHGMGGGVLDYADLARHLGSDQPFYGLQERAMVSEHKPFSRIEAMAAHYIQEIRGIQPQGPYYLGGYCFGGTVAYEMARQLRLRGHQVALLAILDNAAPPNSGYDQSTRGLHFIAEFLKNLVPWLHDFLQLKPDQMVGRIRRKAKILKQRAENHFRRNDDDQGSEIELEALIDNDLSRIPEKRRQLFEAHYQALLNYVPYPYQGEVVLIRTRGDSLFGPFDYDLGWGKLVSGEVKIVDMPGFHANILQEPYVRRLAEHIRRCLEDTRAGKPDF